MDITEFKNDNGVMVYIVAMPEGTVSLQLEWILMLMPALKTVVEDDEKLTKKLEDRNQPKCKIMNGEMVEWLDERFGPEGEVYAVDMNNFYFRNKEDAVEFKLRWI